MPFVLAGLALAWLVTLLFGGTEMDRGLLLLASRLDAPHFKAAAGIFGQLAEPFPLLLIAAAGLACLLVRRAWHDALLLGGLVLAGRVVCALLQIWTAGIRPQLEERVLASQSGAFPSSAAANATITLLALAFLLTRTRPARPVALSAAAFTSLGIGLTQLLRGETWPSDVIGGWAFGLLWVLLPLRLAGHDVGDGTARPVRDEK
jgi:membrane-associated phospholipid phosphatase